MVFKTTGVIDRAFYEEFKKFIVPLRTKIMLAVVVCLTALSSVLMFIIEECVWSVAFLVMLIASVLEYFQLRKRNVNVNLKRNIETTGKEEVEYTVYFEEDGVVSENHSSGGSVKIQYDRFVKIAKCKTVYVLMTKAYQFVPVNVEKFSDSEKNELLDFLRSHAANIKW